MIKHVASVAALAVGLTACGAEDTRETPPSAPPPPTLTVQAESLAAVLPVQGTLEASRRAALSTRMMARVTSVAVEVGAQVRAGQPLIRLGTDDIAAKRVQAEAAVSAAEAARDEAARHAARMDTLHAQDAVPRVQRDAARLGLTQAESQLAMARAALTEVDAASRYAVIAAPFDGAVVRRYVNEGDLASPGMPLLDVEGTGPREAVFAVPADVAGGLTVGFTVVISGGEAWHAEAPIRAVASGADPMTRTVLVRAAVPSDWPTGIAVTALVPTGARLGVAVPEAAVVRRGQLTGVRVLTPEGELLRWVRLGRRVAPVVTGDGTVQERVEVLSGLEPGERIVP